MFGDLKQYRGLDFYKKNPVIEFTPIFSQDIWRWQVFAVMLIDSRLPNTHSEYFDFSKTNFETDAEFAGFINEAYQRSIIDVGTPVELDDQIITLDTCAYDFNDARLIVMAKLVTGDEEFDAASAKYNSDVVYPKAYYKKGETPNKVNSDPVLVEGSVVSVSESSVPAESSDVSSSETSSETTEDNDDDDYDWDDDDGDTETTTSQAASTPVTSTPAVSETTSEAPSVEQPTESVVTPDPEPTSSEDAPEEDASQGQPDG